MYKKITYYILCAVFTATVTSVCASDSTINKPFINKKQIIIGSGLLVYSTTYIGLYSAWYSDYPKSGFHFFNDSKEWFQIDKCGHSYSTYWISRANYKLQKWAGFTPKQALNGSVISSWLFISTIEAFDGFSSEYGASLSDISANTFGALLFGFQQHFWNEQKVLYKFSYVPTRYAAMNPSLLGKTPIERLIKDYNGQTYWLSAPLKDITGIKTLPKWLNIAAGYGATGMVGAFDNKNILDNNIRQRNFYLSFDINLEKIESKNKTIKTLLFMFNCLKFPLPTIQFNSLNTKLLIK